MTTFNHRISTAIFCIVFLCSACSKGGDFRYAKSCLETVQSELDSESSDFSLDMLSYAYHYFSVHPNQEMSAWSHYLNSVVRRKVGLGSDAEWYDDLTKGCEHIDRTDNHALAAKLYLTYGLADIDHRWYEASLAQLRRSLDEAAACGDVRTQVLALMNISRATMLGAIGNDSENEAIAYSKRAVNLATENGDDVLKARAYYSLSACYQNLGFYSEALNAAREYTSISKKLYHEGERKEEVRFIQLARCYHLLANADSAMFYAKLDLKHDDINARINANQLLAAIHSQTLGDSLTALTYNNRYYALRDTLNRQRENDLILVNKSRDDLKRAKHVDTSIILLVIILFTLLAIILFRLILRLKNRLDVNEKELHTEQDTISDLRRHVDTLTKSVRDKEKHVDTLKIEVLDREDLVRSLKKNPHYLKDDEWEKLKDTADKLEPGYLKQLSKYGLTENTTRLAVATKLGFTTSECAEMFSIDPKSITKAKQRLKAKMST